MYVCMYVCMHVSAYVCVCVCVCVYIYMKCELLKNQQIYQTFIISYIQFKIKIYFSRLFIKI